MSATPADTSQPPLPELLRAAPWVRLARILPPDSADLFLKLDHLSPTGSCYDRRVWLLLDRARQHGYLRAGMRVVEGSDGATAVSLAWVCSTLGHPFTACVPESATPETRALLAAYGAEVVVTPYEEGLRGAVDHSERFLAKRDPGQEQAWSPRLHRTTEGGGAQGELLGVELQAAAEAQGRIDAFVCGVGTGATLAAVATLKRRLHPQMKLIAVEPQESRTLSGGSSRPHRLLGIGPNFMPASVDDGVRASIDQTLAIGAAEAWEMKLRLAREEGLLVGIATGAVVAAAVAVAAALGKERTIFTLAYDTGERYFTLSEQLSLQPEVP